MTLGPTVSTFVWDTHSPVGVFGMAVVVHSRVAHTHVVVVVVGGIHGCW